MSLAVTAVVLAGGDRGDSLAAEAGVPAKALLPIGGRPMVTYVLRALADCAQVESVVYVGPTDGLHGGLFDLELPSGARLADSLALGLGAALASASRPVLLLGADVPWIDGAMITRFLEGCQQVGPAAVYYPIVSERASRLRFPDHERTYVRLRDGRFTGANLALVTPEGVPPLLPLIDRVYRARKNPFALAGIVGLDVLASLLLGTASLRGLERRVGALLGLPARAVVSADAELAADVDRPTHLPGVLDPELPGTPLDADLDAKDRSIP